jgi:hypothetical protein
MGIDWWANNPAFNSTGQSKLQADSFAEFEERLTKLEASATLADPSRKTMRDKE